MAFVNELIGEEDKQKIDWTKFQWRDGSYSHRPWKWTIDRDRDVFLVGLVGEGREGDHPEVYMFSFKGELIRFSAKRDSNNHDQFGNFDLNWEVFDMKIPPSLAGQRKEVRQLIKEAVDVFGSAYRRDGINAVFVNFSE